MEVFFASELDKTKVTQANNPISDSQATNYTISQPTRVSSTYNYSYYSNMHTLSRLKHMAFSEFLEH